MFLYLAEPKNKKLAKQEKEDVLLMIMMVLAFIAGWFAMPHVVSNLTLRTLLIVVAACIPLVYIVNLVTLKHKTNSISLLSMLIVVFHFAFGFRGMYSHIEMTTNWYAFFTLFAMVLNAGVVIYNDFDDSMIDINKVLNLFLDVILYVSIILGGRMIFAYFNASVDPPWGELTIDRKIFYWVRVVYYFLMGLIAFTIDRGNTKNKKFGPALISIITISFALYLAFSTYLKIKTDYFGDDLFDFTLEVLMFLWSSFLMVYSIQIINFKHEFELDESIKKVYRVGLFWGGLVLVTPWLIFILDQTSEQLFSFFGTKQDSLLIVLITSIFTSFASTFLVRYYLKKE